MVHTYLVHVMFSIYSVFCLLYTVNCVWVFACVCVRVCKCECVSLHAFMFMYVCVFLRYQPDQPSLAYQMANTQEEMELTESIGAPSMGILPGVEERFRLKTLLFPENTEPSHISGFSVNVCTSILGKIQQCTPTEVPVHISSTM